MKKYIILILSFLFLSGCSGDYLPSSEIIKADSHCPVGHKAVGYITHNNRTTVSIMWVYCDNGEKYETIPKH